MPIKLSPGGTPAFVLAWSVLFLSCPIAGAQTFVTFHPPNAGSTTAQAISDSGEITGYFWDANMGGKERGYLRNSRGGFTVFDVPGAFYTQPNDINANSEVTGTYALSLSDPQRGFIRLRGGQIVTFDAPGALYTTPKSINAAGDVTGMFSTPPPLIQVLGFIRFRAGNFVTFGLPTGSPGAISAMAFAISSGGTVAGAYPYWDGVTLFTRGFLRSPDGALIGFDAPGAVVTQPISINPQGDATGFFRVDNSQLATGGFIRYASGQTLTFEIPSALQTMPMAINARGDVAGMVLPALGSFTRGFVRHAKGDIVLFDVNPNFTQVWGINARGQVVGVAGADGFVGTP